ncbi:hypothetical protein ON010_g13848 [Phytophthora cinnamomi]|nr:hypothetical protein ON010_g13848 [Phytophthora cinnamomi]
MPKTRAVGMESWSQKLCFKRPATDSESRRRRSSGLCLEPKLSPAAAVCVVETRGRSGPIVRLHPEETDSDAPRLARARLLPAGAGRGAAGAVGAHAAPRERRAAPAHLPGRLHGGRGRRAARGDCRSRQRIGRERDAGAPPGAEVRTTTIKTEDGDEITIKRSATSKGNKITTISRDEKGKLTIEDATAEERRAEAETEAEAPPRAEEQDPFADIPTASPSAILKQDSGTARRDQEETAGEEAVVVSGGKKVTVVQVNRSLTKVSLSDVVEEADEDATR